jgi:hypothetical protein
MPVLGSRALVLYADLIDFTDQVSKVRIKVANSDSDFVSFLDAANGGAKDYILTITAKQNTDTTSLWYYAWNEAGTDVEVEVWPNGYGAGGTPTTTCPMFTGTVTVAPPDGDLIGGDANASNAVRWATDLEWKFTAKPTLSVSE